VIAKGASENFLLSIDETINYLPIHNRIIVHWQLKQRR